MTANRPFGAKCHYTGQECGPSRLPSRLRGGVRQEVVSQGQRVGCISCSFVRPHPAAISRHCGIVNAQWIIEQKKLR